MWVHPPTELDRAPAPVSHLARLAHLSARLRLIGEGPSSGGRRVQREGRDRPVRPVQRWIEKNLTNPPMRAALRLGIAPRSFALLETTGRRSGKRRLTPVGNGLDGSVFWLVSEKGRGASYVRNLVFDPRVRVKTGRRWREGQAVLVPEDDGWARRQKIDDGNGRMGRLDGAIFRASATEPLTIRIDLRD